jgi:hypothetical protein
MDEAGPKRAWWTRKRWWAVVVLWLVVLFPASAGPVAYLDGRGWAFARAVKPLYLPLAAVGGRPGNPWLRYVDWFYERGLAAVD